ncbi:hypothetical protein Nepgr_028810 [Nepenthes gracilis]|uniref:Uncharacterized protein n=1 Tax=Nepenthes gracilis TaxID=150966 RepID=A0AAD3Y2F7_NEPGR|nr:hypothetical protein Nepgr_028810 [Nepenthes gracilis]
MCCRAGISGPWQSTVTSSDVVHQPTVSTGRRIPTGPGPSKSEKDSTELLVPIAKVESNNNESPTNSFLELGSPSFPELQDVRLLPSALCISSAPIITEDNLTNTHAPAPIQPVQELDNSEKRNPKASDPSIEGLGPPTSLSPVHGSMMNEPTISVGNIPQATVKVEPKTAYGKLSSQFIHFSII